MTIHEDSVSMSPRALLTAEDAAHLADVTPGTIHAWVRRGHLTRHATPAGPRYLAADVARLARNKALRDGRYSVARRGLHLAAPTWVLRILR